MKVHLGFTQKKHLVRQALMLLQLELWKNELILHNGFEEFIKKNNVDMPPNIGSADIVFRTVKIVDPELFNQIKEMKIADALLKVNTKYGANMTEEEEESFKIKGKKNVIMLPKNVEDIQQKLESKKPITAEDLNTPEAPNRRVEGANYKVEKDGLFGEQTIKKVD